LDWIRRRGDDLASVDVDLEGLIVALGKTDAETTGDLSE